MYKSLVRSHLDYCDVIYHIPPLNTPVIGMSLQTLMEKIERIQYQAALAVTGTWKGTNRNKLYEDLGWESLSDRRMCKRLLQFHKIVDRKTPNYLIKKLPPNHRNLINLPYIFRVNRCRTDRYANSFYPDASCNWNNIIKDFEQFPNFNVLKNHLLTLIRPKNKSTFHIYDPTHLRYTFQLRMGLRNLRSHKKRNN